MSTAIVIGAVLWAAGIVAVWALCRQAAHLDAQADAEDGKGNASQAPGSPGQGSAPEGGA